jgi:hypothetical protein
LKQGTSHNVFNAAYNLLLMRDPETMQFAIENILIDFTGMHTHFEGRLWVPIVSFLLKPWWFISLGIVAIIATIAFFRMVWVPGRSSFQLLGYLLFADALTPILNARGFVGSIIFFWALWNWGAWKVVSLFIMAMCGLAVYFNANNEENQLLLEQALADEERRRPDPNRPRLNIWSEDDDLGVDRGAFANIFIRTRRFIAERAMNDLIGWIPGINFRANRAPARLDAAARRRIAEAAAQPRRRPEDQQHRQRPPQRRDGAAAPVAQPGRALQAEQRQQQERRDANQLRIAQPEIPAQRDLPPVGVPRPQEAEPARGFFSWFSRSRPNPQPARQQQQQQQQQQRQQLASALVVPAARREVHHSRRVALPEEAARRRSPSPSGSAASSSASAEIRLRGPEPGPRRRRSMGRLAARLRAAAEPASEVASVDQHGPQMRQISPPEPRVERIFSRQ